MQRIGLHQVDPADVADGSYAVTVAGGKVTGLADAGLDSLVLPLTTATNGVPELVWDGDDELVLTEVPL